MNTCSTTPAKIGAHLVEWDEPDRCANTYRARGDLVAAHPTICYRQTGGPPEMVPIPPSGETQFEPTSLYRYYDTKGVLIYVGITRRGATRNAEHNQSQPWWKYVARQDVQHFPDRATALTAEKSVIRSHRPPFNKQHNPDKGELATAYIALREQEVPLRSPGVVMTENRGRLPMDIIAYDGIFMTCRARPDDISLASRILFELSGFNRFAVGGCIGFVTEWRRSGFTVEMTLKGRWLGRVTAVNAQVARSKKGYYVRTVELLIGDRWIKAQPQRFSDPFADDQDGAGDD